MSIVALRRLYSFGVVLVVVAGMAAMDVALIAQPVAAASQTTTKREDVHPEDMPLLPAGNPRTLPGKAVPDGDGPPLGAEALDALRTDRIPGKGFSDESVVDEELTTPTQEVFENSDGSLTAVVNTRPVRWEDGAGAWHDIDPAAKPQPNGSVAPASSGMSLEVPADPADGLVRDETPVGVISFGHPDVVENPLEPIVVDGNAVIRDKSGAVASTVRFTSTGFEHDIVYSTSAAAQPASTIEVTLPAGVTARAGGPGVEFVNGEGTVIASFGGGIAFDSSTPSPGERAETSVLTELVGQADSVATIRVSIDQVWLEAPGRVWPVTVDPTYQRNTAGDTTSAQDTFVQSDLSSSQYGNAALKTGTIDGGWTIRRSLLWFDLGSLPSPGLRKVTEAHLAINNYYAASCSARSVVLYEPAARFNSTTNWGNQPASLGNVSSTSLAGGYNSTCPGGWKNLDLTALAKDWVEGGTTNNGIGLKASSETDSVAAKTYYSGNSGHGAAAAPALVINYNNAPNAVVQTGSSPGHEAVVTTPTPVLTTATATDPDGQAVQYRFRVATAPDAESGAIVAESGWLSTPSWAIGSSFALPDGDYYWHVWTTDGDMERVASWANQLTVNRRLGTSTAAPTHSAGPVSVNLATGNAAVTTSSPTSPTAGGGIGMTYSYNSQAPKGNGLNGQYWSDETGNRLFDDGDPMMTRVDSRVGFDWRASSPHPEISADDFLVRWTGFVTMPANVGNGNWTFGAESDDGVRVKIAGTTELDNWVTQSQQTKWAPSATTMGTTTKTITVEYMESAGSAFVKLLAKDSNGVVYWIPSDWLTTAPPALPNGWGMSADLNGQLSAARLQVNNNTVTVVDAESATRTYQRNGSGFTPPVGEDAVLALTTEGYMLQEVDGMTYRFDRAGQLLQAVSAVDDLTPTAPTYTWASVEANSPARLTTITDPVSQRSITLTYSTSAANCGAPTWMLCKVMYWDNTETVLQYSNGQLSRIVDPGDEVTNFGYGTDGRLNTIQDPLSSDAVAAQVQNGVNTGYSTPTATYTDPLTVITYANGKVSKVETPDPHNGKPRPTTTYDYAVSGETKVAEVGDTNSSGWTELTKYNAGGLPTQVTNRAGLNTTTVWDTKADHLLWTRDDAAQLTTSNVYDATGRVKTQYGPAPAGDITGYGTLTPGAPQPPQTDTFFDEGIISLATTYWQQSNPSKRTHATGVGGAQGKIATTWPTTGPTGLDASDNWYASLTGEINFPTTGSYQLAITKYGRVKLYVDDILQLDHQTDSGTSTLYTYPIAFTGGKARRIRIEYFDDGGTALLELKWKQPDGTTTYVPGTYLSPRYGLLTTTKTARSVNSGVTTWATTTTGYTTIAGRPAVDPAQGLATVEIIDPLGLNLRTETDYEATGVGHKRRIARRLPAGNQWDYQHYSGGDTRANPCVAGSPSVHQGGATRKGLGPQNSEGKRLTEESVYDISGRLVATRTGSSTDGNIDSEQWICTSYDARGRATTIDYPAWGGQPARQVTTIFQVNGNPLITSTTDPAGTISSSVDITGRMISYTDALGWTTTTAYDQSGRVASITGPVGPGGNAGTVTNTYDSVSGQLAAVNRTGGSIPGNVGATITYDVAGRTKAISYTNGVASDNINYDLHGRQSSLAWKSGLVAITSDAVVRDLTDAITSQNMNGVTSTNSYDGAGRLATAITGPTTYQYLYGVAPTECPSGQAAPGLNTNRTRTQVTGQADTTYCYDNADRLLSYSANTAPITYDSHGNTTGIDGQTMTYDVTNRHVDTTVAGPPAATTVSYVRDVTDRIITRKVNGIIQSQYLSSGGGDTPEGALDANGTLSQVTLTLPGGGLVTLKASAQTWSLPNLHGDVAAMTDGSGSAMGGTLSYDPYGNAVAGTPDNSAGAFDYGWVGQHQRSVEHQAGLSPIIEMGARQYHPGIGRFLEVDPVEGGSSNDYDYVGGDPVNDIDLEGAYRRKRCIRGSCLPPSKRDHYTGWSRTRNDFWTGKSACAGICWKHLGTQTRYKYRYVWNTRLNLFKVYRNRQTRAVYQTWWQAGWGGFSWHETKKTTHYDRPWNHPWTYWGTTS